jgi:predicted CxxxxCH...CXXCH cytochrome family protein
MSSRRVTLVSLFALAVAACDARPVRSSASMSASTSAELATCTQCHGDAAQQNAAPPRGVNGATDTTDPAVGAHQSHLVAGHFRGPVACQDCHVVPATVYEPGHMGGVMATVRFDAPGSTGLASARGTSPSVTFGPADPADAQRRPDATCTVYCHGATLDGGTRSRPSWAGHYEAGSTTLDCMSCHGFPPGGKHPQNFERTPDAPARACGRCHPRTVAADGSIDLASGKHINGVVDFAGGDACSVCHGDPTRQGVPGSDPLVQAAPPLTITGAAPGAHLQHVNGVGTPLRPPLPCTECHANIAQETTTLHPDDKVDVDFGSLARNASWGGVTPTPSWDGASCSGTYCHGAFRNGANATIAWAQGATLGCTSCHGAPPGGGHPKNASCGNCHLGYTSTSVDPSKHVNGVLDVIPLTCTSCHGDATQTATPDAPFWAAPPVDTAGQTSSTAVGAHQVHLNGSAISAAIACTECHPVPTTTIHATGTVAFAWGGLATSGGAKPSFDAASATCSSTYCHGNYQGTFNFTFPDAIQEPAPQIYSYAGGAGSPRWSDGAMTCGSCHAMPPNNAVWHSGSHGGGNQCQLCHPDATGTISSSGIVTGAAITSPAQHVNGVVEISAVFKSTCFGCH